MAASSGGTFNAKEPSPTPAEIRSLQRLHLVAAAVYLSWWFVVELVLPGAYNPLLTRLAVVGAFLVSFATSFKVEAVRHNLSLAFTACCWLLTLHYYYLLHRNGGDMPWAVGAYLVAFAVGACLPTRRSLLAYTALTLGLGLLVSLVDRALLRSIFLAGLATMTLLSNLTLHTRLLLERERAERMRVDAARAVAEAGVVLRDEFISIASHELRTPLASLQLAVQGLSRAMQRAGGPPSAEILERSLEICQRQTTRLARLVEGLLDASQITGGRFELRCETVSLLELARDVAHSFVDDAARSGSQIEVTGDAAVSGLWDRMRLEQVVSNLLRNAIAFGLGRPIRVIVTEEGDTARLTVKDEGMGIAREEQTRIFGRFERAVSARNYGGMGLGLYVVSQIVDAHGGRVSLESEPGMGATFVVSLPRQGQAANRVD